MALDFVVVHGANLSCTLGTVPSTLTVAASEIIAQSKNVGIVSDKIVGTFGTCSALGPGPCAPVFPGNWSPGCLKMESGGIACMKKSDILTCSVGGSISITNAGQTKVRAE